MLARAAPLLPLPAAAAVAAAETASPDDSAGGASSALIDPKLARDTDPPCLSGFATPFSGAARMPIHSAEHLATTCIEAARSDVASTRGREPSAARPPRVTAA